MQRALRDINVNLLRRKLPINSL